MTNSRVRAMLKVGNEITDPVIMLRSYNNGSSKNESCRRRKVLIKDGKYCYIDFLDEYINRKRRQLRTIKDFVFQINRNQFSIFQYLSSAPKLNFC